MNWEECYYNHFVEYLEESVERMSLPEKPALKVTIHKGISEHVTYCTLGLSKYLNELGVRCEVFLVANHPSLNIGILLIDILTYGLRVQVHTMPPNLRPLIVVEPTSHPLAIEQRQGITTQKVQEKVEQLLHPS